MAPKAQVDSNHSRRGREAAAFKLGLRFFFFVIVNCIFSFIFSYSIDEDGRSTHLRKPASLSGGLFRGVHIVVIQTVFRLFEKTLGPIISSHRELVTISTVEGDQASPGNASQ